MGEDYWPLSPFLYKNVTISLINLAQSSAGYRGEGEGGSPKKFFSAVRPSVWFKNKGGGTPPLDLSLQSHEQNSNCNIALTRIPEGKRKQRLLGGTKLKKRQRKRAGMT